MNLFQAIMWIVGGVVVFVVIRMLWAALFESPETDASLPRRDDATATNSSEADDAEDEVEADGTWIEIDIEPLFPSSQGSMIDLTSEQEPESRP